jgi:hypothetical protein
MSRSWGIRLIFWPGLAVRGYLTGGYGAVRPAADGGFAPMVRALAARTAAVSAAMS